MIAKTQKNINNTWKIKSNTRKLLKIKRTHFFVKYCHPKILKVHRVLLIVYSINNKMNNYFSKLAANLSNKENNESNLTTLLKNLPDENYDQPHDFIVFQGFLEEH